MRSIAILNQKGGVGKTTTAVNLAAALARAGSRILLIDLDPQSHATLHLGVESDRRRTIYDVLAHETALVDVARTVDERLELVPAVVDLVGAELELADRSQREHVLARALHPVRDRFDLVLVDCPPALGLLTVNALAAVGEVLIPLQPHFLALQGLGRLLETIALVRRELNPVLRVTGVVLCLYEKGTRLAQEVQDDVARFLAAAEPDTAWYGARVLEPPIRRNIKLAECPSFGQTIFQYAPGSHGAEDYLALARAVLAAAPDAPPAAAATLPRAAQPTAAAAPEGVAAS